MKGPLRLHRWHQTRAGLLIFGLAELALSSALTLHAFDTGSLWEYLIAAILLVGFLQNGARFIRTFLNGPQRTR